jgi:NAD(P)-dependent dehydrogenase (short-subunit alcohol dehydrogenase family)
MAGTFGAMSTADDVLAGLDLRGKRALVTGVSAGIGVETARALAAHGAEVIGAVRGLAKSQAAMVRVQTDAKKGGRLSLVELDLASLASVRACAERLATEGPFDLIVANAGVMGPPFGRTADDFEIQFGTNHLGHFVLVNRLAPHMRPGSRVVVLASSAHHIADIDLDDPNFERTEFSPYLGYGRSKTANILFAVEFDRRHRTRGIRAAAVHPGAVETELGRHIDPETREAQRRKLEAAAGAHAWTFVRKTVAQGAATSVWAGVVAPADEVGGHYCEDCHVAEVVAPGVPVGPMGPGVASYAVELGRAAALWAKSEELVGERY